MSREFIELMTEIGFQISKLEDGTIDKDEFVLRRPPHGAKIKTGHDMFREFNILSKLFPFFNKIPKVISYCEDVKVIGAPFYLMEKINGVIIRGNSKIINKLDIFVF